MLGTCGLCCLRDSVPVSSCLFLQPITQALDTLRNPQEENCLAWLSLRLVLGQGHGLGLSLGVLPRPIELWMGGEGRRGATELTEVEPDLKTCTVWSDWLIPT